jgi:thioredoxin-like negative regulator of GroEL
MQARGNRDLAINDTEPGDAIPTVTGETFIPLVLNGQGPIVVEFMSYACAHCAEIEPVLQQVAEIVKSQEKIFRVNTGIERRLADQYQISGTPTLIMFLNGAEVGRIEGPPPIASSLLAEITTPFES